MLGNQQRKIGVLRLQGRVFIAVAVHGNDAVRVFVHHRSARVHAEGAHQILVFFGFVDDLAFIHLVGDMAEHRGRQLHAHADIHPVRFRRDAEAPADALHPARPAAPHRGNADRACKLTLRRGQHIPRIRLADLPHRAAEEKIHLALQFLIERGQHLVVDVRAKMAHRRVQ